MFNAGRFTPGKQPRYPMQRRLCGLQGRLTCKWRSENLLPSKFEPPDRPVHRKLFNLFCCPTQGYYHLTVIFVCFPFLLPVTVLLTTCLTTANCTRHTRSLAWLCGRSIAGLNSAGAMVICLLWGSCVWGLLLFQRNPTDCGASKSNREASIMRESWSSSACCAMGKVRHSPSQRANSH